MARTDRCFTCRNVVEFVDVKDPYWRHAGTDGGNAHPARPLSVLKERLFAAYDADPSMSYAEVEARKAFVSARGPRDATVVADLRRYRLIPR
ncbi:hypothetical protein EYA84_01930 [Verrucosispora sp. SN26_14.1]|uniref:hypothetical protein n=1 Tax=Verrucosispora sp. SN26_14.1 TaxID=2527879 RepID=UPI0010354CDC|nr:hypothetical protein [Verrucosispora sp. SN26_14.1]TBL44224.1 hypothetical protein EYA84_01930 [Verrucosispora sp. SN26_14.1]